MGNAYRTDPVLALIEPDELSEFFLAIPEEEQSWRGRLFLAVYWWTHDVAFSWWAALGEDERTTIEWRRMMEQTPDRLLIARTHALRAELAAETREGLAGA